MSESRFVFQRVAVIAESFDGTRMMYELDERGPMSMRIEQHHQIDRSTMSIVSEPPMVTVRGALKRGVVWHGDMPTPEQAQIEAPRKEVDDGGNHA